MTMEQNAQTKQAEWMPEPALYSIKQAGMFLGVSQRTVYNLVRNGELVGRHIGRRTLIPFTSLQNFLKRDHKTQPKEKSE